MYRSLAALSASSVLAALSVPAAAGDIGIRVMVQPWTPYTDDETIYTPIDHPTLVSDALHQGWLTGGQVIDDTLTSLLGTGDLLTPGVTLYDIDLGLPEPIVSVRGLGENGPGPLLLEGSVVLDDVHLEATARTPTPFGEYLDPRCRIDFDLTATLPIGLGTDVTSPLSTPLTPEDAAAQPIIRISDFRLDSEGAVCDLIIAGMELFEVDDLLTDLVTDPSSEVASDLNATLIGLVQDALVQANAEIAAVVPPGLVQVNAWAPASHNPITLAFSADASVWPWDGLTGGEISGTYVSPTGTLACADVPVAIARKTGPRPIISADGVHRGEVPTEPLVRSWDCEEVDGVMTYRLGGLAESFPTLIGAHSETFCDGSNDSGFAYTRWINGFGGRMLPSDLWGYFPITGDEFAFDCSVPGEIPPGVDEIYENIDDPLLDPDYPTNPEWWLEGWVYTGLETNTAIQVTPLSLELYHYGL